MHPNQELNQEPGRPMMGFFRPKNTPSPPGGVKSPTEPPANAKLPDDDPLLHSPIEPKHHDMNLAFSPDNVLNNPFQDPTESADPPAPSFPLSMATAAVDAPEHWFVCYSRWFLVLFWYFFGVGSGEKRMLKNRCGNFFPRPQCWKLVVLFDENAIVSVVRKCFNRFHAVVEWFSWKTFFDEKLWFFRFCFSLL